MAQRQQQQTLSTNWLTALKAVVKKKPIVLFRFSEDEWERLRNSRRGTNAFTFARTHESLHGVRPATACLLTENEYGRDAEIHFGLLESSGAVTTLETRLKITTAQPIEPSSETEILVSLPTIHSKEFYAVAWKPRKLSSGYHLPSAFT